MVFAGSTAGSTSCWDLRYYCHYAICFRIIYAQ
uniref:Uncharacterized protein n=1 Tax=Rhizophora mucronata TaxID=61149 RepID=A0A2P2KIW4_RHIMU